MTFKPAGRSTVIVKINSYRDSNPQGVMTGGGLEPVRFQSMFQLLMAIEALMDANDKDPQRDAIPRSFSQQSGAPPTGQYEGQGEEAIATFQLNILFRQNSSWQGVLTWMDRSLETPFRSVLELVRLMDSAVSKS